MKVLVCDLVPKSVQAKSKAKYQKAIADLWQAFHGSGTPNSVECYGVVYYFHRRVSGLDADNISKPIWDALNKLAYLDDKLVRLRHAGMIRNDQDYVSFLDLTGMPDAVVDDFLRLLDSSDHVLYVEVGRLNPHLFRVGLETV